MSTINEDISELRLTPGQWEFIKREEGRRTRIAAEQARDVGRYQQAVLSELQKSIEIMAKHGLDDRDYFAAQALAGYIANKDGWGTKSDVIAKECYEIADSMLKARGGE